MIDLHALLINNFEHRVLRIELLLYIGGVLVGENRGEMFLVTQDAAHEGFFC